MSYSSETQEIRDAYDAWLDAINEKIARDLSKRYYDTPTPLEVLTTSPGRCECGGDAVGATRHPEYCPKYENT